MNPRAILFPAPPSLRASVGLLLARLFVGGALMNHGWKKIQDPFHWMDKAASPAPAVFQFLAAVAEFFGGAGLALGALTVLASLGVACTMAVAIATHVSKGDPFGKWELAALFLAVATVLVCTGAGRLSIDALLQGRKPSLGPGTTGGG